MLQVLLLLGLGTMPLAAIFAIYCRLLPNKEWMRRWVIVFVAALVLVVVTFIVGLANFGPWGVG